MIHCPCCASFGRLNGLEDPGLEMNSPSSSLEGSLVIATKQSDSDGNLDMGTFVLQLRSISGGSDAKKEDVDVFLSTWLVLWIELWVGRFKAKVVMLKVVIKDLYLRIIILGVMMAPEPR